MLSVEGHLVSNRPRARAPLTVSAILERLARVSARPRYSYMVLSLIAESADQKGEAGPFIKLGAKALPVRDWVAEMLAPTAERTVRRTQLRERVARELQSTLSRDAEEAQRQIEAAVAERVRAVGRANVSRAVSDLVKAQFVRRHYAGWVKDHARRGGHRHAVYTVEAETLAALRRSTHLL